MPPTQVISKAQRKSNFGLLKCLSKIFLKFSAKSRLRDLGETTEPGLSDISRTDGPSATPIR